MTILSAKAYMMRRLYSLPLLQCVHLRRQEFTNIHDFILTFEPNKCFFLTGQFHLRSLLVTVTEERKNHGPTGTQPRDSRLPCEHSAS